MHAVHDIIHPPPIPYYQNHQGLSAQNQLSRSDPSQNLQNKQQMQKPSKSLLLMFSYLYLAQGIIVALGTTIPYTYKQLPNYKVMSIFASVGLPYSLKFFIAPFTQRVNFITYGKRKTWIMIGQISASFCLLASSFYTSQQHSYVFAILLLFTNFSIAFQDIALDSLAIKQLKIPHLISSIESIFNTVGAVFGSLVLLKLTSLEFANYLNLSNPITTTSTLIIILALSIFAVSCLIHLFFKQTILESEKQVQKKSICEVICYYKIFFNPIGRQFRLAIFFIIYLQGFNFFVAGYDYELIKAGFSRNTSNTITNIITIPIIILTFFCTRQIQKVGLLRSSLISMSLLVVLRTYVLISFPKKSSQIVFFVYLFTQILYTWQYLVVSIMINLTPVVGVSGMIMTALASSSNLGQEKGIHTYFLSVFGWKNCSLFGLLLQCCIIICLPLIFKWINKSKYLIQEIQQEYIKKEEQPCLQQNNQLIDYEYFHDQ